MAEHGNDLGRLFAANSARLMRANEAYEQAKRQQRLAMGERVALHERTIEVYQARTDLPPDLVERSIAYSRLAIERLKDAIYD